MTPKEKQRLAEIRQGAKAGTREGYRTFGGRKYTLARSDILELLKYINDLELWIKQEAKHNNICTFDLTMEVCNDCKCNRKGNIQIP